MKYLKKKKKLKKSASHFLSGARTWNQCEMGAMNPFFFPLGLSVLTSISLWVLSSSECDFNVSRVFFILHGS